MSMNLAEGANALAFDLMDVVYENITVSDQMYIQMMGNEDRCDGNRLVHFQFIGKIRLVQCLTCVRFQSKEKYQVDSKDTSAFKSPAFKMTRSSFVPPKPFTMSLPAVSSPTSIPSKMETSDGSVPGFGEDLTVAKTLYPSECKALASARPSPLEAPMTRDVGIPVEGTLEQY